jgi:hypothetical protein
VDEPEHPLPGHLVVREDFRPGDVGRHQVRGELDAVEGEGHAVRQGADHERLGQPRHPDQQTMAAGQDGNEQLLHHRLLADDHLAALAEQLAAAGPQPLGRLQVVVEDDRLVGGRFGGHEWPRQVRTVSASTPGGRSPRPGAGPG